MSLNFPALDNLTDLLPNSLSGPPSLLLLQEREHLACVICKKNFLKISVQAVFRVSCKDGHAPALRALEKLCMENGFAQLWKGKVGICLHADDALFLDFHLPPSSRSKVEKTIPLLLDEELPLPQGSYLVKTFLSREDGYYAISTIIQKHLMEEWRDSLEKCEFKEANISVFPWPLLKALPSPKAPALLICLSPSGSLICALNSRGAPLRIRHLPHDKDKAGVIARQLRLMLADIDFVPHSLLFFGSYNAPELKKVIVEEFNLPGQTLGNDLPLAGTYERLEEDDSARILAHCMNYRPWSRLSAIPLSTLKFKREKRKTFPWAIPVVLCLALIGIAEIFSLYNSLNNFSKAESIKNSLLERLRSDLDNIPKNSSPGRLIAILNSRLMELEKRDSQAGGQFVTLLEGIHKASPAEAHLGLNRLAYDTKHMRLNGNANTYEEVNSLKNSIEKMDNIESVRIVNAATIQGRGNARQQIDFELDLVLK